VWYRVSGIQEFIKEFSSSLTSIQAYMDKLSVEHDIHEKEIAKIHETLGKIRNHLH